MRANRAEARGDVWDWDEARIGILLPRSKSYRVAVLLDIHLQLELADDLWILLVRDIDDPLPCSRTGAQFGRTHQVWNSVDRRGHDRMKTALLGFADEPHLRLRAPIDDVAVIENVDAAVLHRHVPVGGEDRRPHRHVPGFGGEDSRVDPPLIMADRHFMWREPSRQSIGSRDAEAAEIAGALHVADVEHMQATLPRTESGHDFCTVDATTVGRDCHHVDVGGPLELALQFGIQAVRGIVDAEPSCVLLAPASNSSRVGAGDENFATWCRNRVHRLYRIDPRSRSKRTGFGARGSLTSITATPAGSRRNKADRLLAVIGPACLKVDT